MSTKWETINVDENLQIEYTDCFSNKGPLAIIKVHGKEVVRVSHDLATKLTKVQEKGIKMEFPLGSCVTDKINESDVLDSLDSGLFKICGNVSNEKELYYNFYGSIFIVYRNERPVLRTKNMTEAVSEYNN